MAGLPTAIIAASSCGVAARPTHKPGNGSTWEQGEGAGAGGVGVELDAVGEGEAEGVGEAGSVGLEETWAVGLEPQAARAIARAAANQIATMAHTRVADGRLARRASKSDPTPGPSLTSIAVPPPPALPGPNLPRDSRRGNPGC
jgi:hypothetical protein